MDNAIYDTWVEMIHRVARNTSRDYPDSTTEDLEQTLWERIIKMLKQDSTLTPSTQYMESTLYFVAKRQAGRDRQQYLTLSDQYNYRTQDVRKLLPTFFDKRYWSEAELPEDQITATIFVDDDTDLDGNVIMRYKIEYDFNARLDMMSDLSEAWDKLPDQYRAIIVDKFYFDLTVDSKKLSTAISRMADILNTPNTRKHEGPGRRRAISNTTAGGIIANQNGQ